jgi:hypothetical protein
MVPLSSPERGSYYAITATVIEITYTVVTKLPSKWPHLQGYTQLWVIPIYGLGSQYVFEPLVKALSEHNILIRVVSYAGMFFSLEFIAATIIDFTTGVVPWEYKSRFQLGFNGKGYICLFPHCIAWAGLGYLGEFFSRYLDTLRRLY